MTTVQACVSDDTGLNNRHETTKGNPLVMQQPRMVIRITPGQVPINSGFFIHRPYRDTYGLSHYYVPVAGTREWVATSFTLLN